MRRILFILAVVLTAIGLQAQQRVTVEAQSYQVSDNLDLEAVAITFGESKNIEDFERRLNDPDNRLSNLDLNNDGYVDFLRVVEVEEKGTHLVVIQAVIGDNLFQDVATVIVEGENETSATVTIVGSRDIYGDNYVIVPKYVVRPVIFGWFWTPTYVVYHSGWYWGFYPSYYHSHLCWGYHTYHRHMHRWHTHYHDHCHFHRPKEYHHSAHHVEMHRGVGRNDYVTHRPNAGYRKEPTPNRNLEARPVGGRSNGTAIRTNTTQQGRPAGSVSTSERNTATRRTTSTTLPARPSTSTTRSTSTTARPSTSTTRSTSTTVRPSTSTTRSTSTTARPSTSTIRSTSTTVRPSTTTTRSTSTTVRPSTSITRSTTTTARPSTSTTRSTSTTTARPSTSTTRSTSTTARPTTSTTRSTSTTARPSTSTTRSTSTTARPTTSTTRSTSTSKPRRTTR